MLSNSFIATCAPESLKDIDIMVGVCPLGSAFCAGPNSFGSGGVAQKLFLGAFGNHRAMLKAFVSLQSGLVLHAGTLGDEDQTFLLFVYIYTIH